MNDAKDPNQDVEDSAQDSALVYQKPWQPEKMVKWYDPGQLAKTGVRVATSAIFAENADGRVIQPLLEARSDKAPDSRGGKGAPWDHCKGETLVIDYVGDPGDGFNPTYAIAHAITQSWLGPEGAIIPPSTLLIFGGDEVYPAASEEAYHRRLVKPYELASIGADKRIERRMYAIPGNHDWYDNLVAFTRLFIDGRKLGQWKLPQRRSYFAIELPQKWWLIGTDVQLGSDLDGAQERFFYEVAAKLPDDANIILCHAEPHWVYENEWLRTDNEEPLRGRRLGLVEKALDGETQQRVRVLIAGDLHHYRRHVAQYPTLKGRETHLITAGGGGAFLHPTHGWRDESDPWRAARDKKANRKLRGYENRASYPDVEKSRQLGRTAILGLLRTNPWFAAASAAVYGIVALNFLAATREECPPKSLDCAGTLAYALLNPGTLTWVLLMVSAFVLATDTSSRVYRWAAGILHGLAHAACAVAIPALVVHLGGAVAVGKPASASIGDQALAGGGFVLALLACALLGGLLGSLLMGFYLYVSLNGFGRHRNETFSAIGIQDYKNFLRLRIDEKGTLTICAYGIDQTPAKWHPEPTTVAASLSDHEQAPLEPLARPEPADGRGSVSLIDYLRIPQARMKPEEPPKGWSPKPASSPSSRTRSDPRRESARPP